MLEYVLVDISKSDNAKLLDTLTPCKPFGGSKVPSWSTSTLLATPIAPSPLKTVRTPSTIDRTSLRLVEERLEEAERCNQTLEHDKLIAKQTIHSLKKKIGDLEANLVRIMRNATPSGIQAQKDAWKSALEKSSKEMKKCMLASEAAEAQRVEAIQARIQAESHAQGLKEALEKVLDANMADANTIEALKMSIQESEHHLAQWKTTVKQAEKEAGRLRSAVSTLVSEKQRWEEKCIEAEQMSDAKSTEVEEMKKRLHDLQENLVMAQKDLEERTHQCHLSEQHVEETKHAAKLLQEEAEKRESQLVEEWEMAIQMVQDTQHQWKEEEKAHQSLKKAYEELTLSKHTFQQEVSTLSTQVDAVMQELRTARASSDAHARALDLAERDIERAERDVDDLLDQVNEADRGKHVYQQLEMALRRRVDAGEARIQALLDEMDAMRTQQRSSEAYHASVCADLDLALHALRQELEESDEANRNVWANVTLQEKAQQETQEIAVRSLAEVYQALHLCQRERDAAYQTLEATQLAWQSHTAHVHSMETELLDAERYVYEQQDSIKHIQLSEKQAIEREMMALERIDALERAQEKQQQVHAASLQQLRTSHDAEIHALTSALEEVQREKADVQELWKAWRAESADKEAAHLLAQQDKDAQIDALKRQLDDGQTIWISTQEHVQRVEKELEDAKEACHTLEANAGDLSSEQQKVHALSETVQMLSVKMESMESTCQHHVQHIEQLEASLQSRSQGPAPEAWKALEEQCQTQSEQLKRMQHTMDQDKKTIQSMEEEFERMETWYAEETKIQTTRAARLQELETAKVQWTTEKADMTTQERQWKEEIQKQTVEITQWEAAYQSLQEEAQEKLNLMAQASEQAADLLEKMQSERDGLKSSLQRLHAELERMGISEERLQSLYDENGILRKEYEHTRNEATKLARDNAKLAGHQNEKQKIRYIMTLRKENTALKKLKLQHQEEIARLTRKLRTSKR